MEKVGKSQIELIQTQGILVETDVSGRKMSTFMSGGFIDYVVFPKTIDEFKKVLEILSGCKFHLLGFGSNTLISDNGVHCIVTTRKMQGIKIDETQVTALAGQMVHALVQETAKSGLSGLEFLVGIPATVGGTVAMNAGAFGREVKDVLKEVQVYKDGNQFVLTKKDLSMSYRNTKLNGATILSAKFELTVDEPANIEERIKQNLEYRKMTQPTEPSLGCVYKKVGGKSAAFYIQGAGLKGQRIGYASISGKHCNFIVNQQGATSKDYLRLMDKIETTVYDKYGVVLEREIKFIKD